MLFDFAIEPRVASDARAFYNLKSCYLRYSHTATACRGNATPRRKMTEEAAEDRDSPKLTDMFLNISFGAVGSWDGLD